jgi:hypothetical protein
MANGIPPLLDKAAYIADMAALLTGDALISANMFKPSGWAVYGWVSGVPGMLDITDPVFVVANAASKIASSVTNGFTNPLGLRVVPGSKMPDSIISMDYKREYKISDAPQELGAFQSYNKVQKPAVIHLRMAKGGSAADRDAFLAWIELQAAGTKLLAIQTPEQTYGGYCIQDFDYRKSSTDGAGIAIVDVEFLQVRETVVSTLGKATPSVASAQPMPQSEVDAFLNKAYGSTNLSNSTILAL